MHPLQERFESAEQDCQRYLDLLEQERDALTRQDMAMLEPLLAQKRSLADALVVHDQAIRHYCQTHNISQDQLAAHIEQAGDPSSSRATSSSLRRWPIASRPMIATPALFTTASTALAPCLICCAIRANRVAASMINSAIAAAPALLET